MSELKPCPFCGGKQDLQVEMNDHNSWSIQCKTPHCLSDVSTGDWDSKSGAIAAWNNRAEVPAGWRSIPKEVDTSNPPFDGSEVLIWGEGQDGAYLAIYEADTNEPWKIADTHPSGWTPLVDAPTHWMPLPAPPESEADRD